MIDNLRLVYSTKVVNSTYLQVQPVKTFPTVKSHAHPLRKAQKQTQQQYRREYSVFQVVSKQQIFLPICRAHIQYHKNTMENGHTKPPQDQSSESSRSQQSKPDVKEQQSPIYQCDWFPMTTSPWIASVSFLFQIFLPIYMIDFYAENSNKVFNTTGSFTMISGFIVKGMESIAYVFCTIMSLLSLMTLMWNKCEEQEGYKYILGWLGTKIFPFLRYIIDINLAIATIFMIRTPIVAAFFFIAAAINLIISFFCQNYTLRKDYLCCKSMPYLMVWKISVVLSYSVSCIGFYIINSSLTLIIFTSIQFVIMLALFIFYFISGYLMYRHPSSQFAYLLILNLFCSVALGNMYDTFLTILTNQFVINRNLMLAGFFFLFLGVLMFSLWSNIRKKCSLIENKNPIERIYFMFHKLENSSENINDDCQVRGMIRYHLSHTCKNINCFVNLGEENFYDSKKNKYCFGNKLNQGKTSFVKFIVKCIYEQELQDRKWSNIDLLLDYIQFYYMKLKNLFEVTILLISLEKKFLTPFQKLRLARLRRVMLEENRKLNEELYNGGLDLQNLIASETKYDEIQQQIRQLQSQNIAFWKYIQNYSINLSIMVKMLKPSFGLVDKINTNWKSIAKYFQIQKVWKFMFACYTLYFRNQKLKPQLLEQFGQTVHEDELFATDSLHMNKTTQANCQYVSKMIFEQDVCCVHINHNQEKPIIKSVSRYFERIFGYNYSQIIQSTLDIMMTPSFQAFHRAKFLKWAESGKSNKQQNYQVKKVFPVNKSGYIISAFKFYKQYLCVNNELQYVGMFKKNKEQEYVMILNGDYEIEGMTQSLANKLNISPQAYKHIVGLNLLILIPDLVKFTKFEEESRNMAQNLIYMQPTSIVNPTISCEMSEKGTSSKKSTINSNREFTKSNLHLAIPDDIKTLKETYLLQSSTNLTHRLANCIKLIKQTQNKRKYKIQIEVRMVHCGQDTSYLEFYIREVQSTEKTQNKCAVNPGTDDPKSEQGNDEGLKQQDLTKFFQNSHSSQNISLAFSDNIFIKQDNNQPVQMISYVKEITLIVRVIFVIFFGFLVSSLLFEYSNYQSYKQNSLKTYAMVKLQLELFMLDNKYNSEILGLRETSETISSLTTSLRQTRQKNIQFKKSILDPSINNYKIYNITIAGKTQSYDQIDIIDKMFESIIQMLYSFESAGTITPGSFQSFSNIVLPSVQHLTTDVTQHISSIFDQIYHKIEIKNYVYIAGGIILLVLAFVMILFKLIKISKSFVNLVEIFTQFNEADLKKIIRYCLFLEQLFSHLRKKYDIFKQTNPEPNPKSTLPQQFNNASISNGSYSYKLGMSSLNNPDTVVHDQNQEQDNANLNKKVKKVVIGKQLTNLKIKSIVFSVVFLFLYGLTTFGLGLYTSLINQQIISYKNSGEQIFQYYSSLNIYYLSVKDRMIQKQKFNWNKYQLYSNRLQEMKKLQYKVAQRLSADYMKIRNGVLFNNVCDITDILLANNYTVDTCITIADNNFQHGIQSFLFYLITNVEYYQAGTSLTMDSQILKQLEKGMSISNIYLKYLLEKWSEYFTSLMALLEMNIIVICSGLFLLQIVIYIVLVEVLIVGNLKDKFLFFRKVYNYLMPDFIVTKEKIIKAKLEVQGFIKK